MAVTPTAAYIQALIIGNVNIISGTSTFTFSANSTSTIGLQSLVAGGANGTMVESISIASTDTASKNIWFALMATGAVVSPLTVVSVAASKGTDGSSAPLDLLRAIQVPGLPYDPQGNKCIYVPNGYTLWAGCDSGITGGKQISIIAHGGNL